MVAILIRSLIVQPFYIPSSSMESTLLIGDRIFVSKFTYVVIVDILSHLVQNLLMKEFFIKTKKGDLVVFKTPS